MSEKRKLSYANMAAKVLPKNKMEKNKDKVEKHHKEKEAAIVEDVETKLREKKLKKSKGMKKLRSWFCDNPESDKSGFSDVEWEGVSRKFKNKLRKKKAAAKKKAKQDDTTEKDERILGIGPIVASTLKFFMRKTNNIEKAKIGAVQEWLAFYLKFEDEEIQQMDINATQLAAKGDIIYVSFDNSDSIKEIHMRAAECRNDEIILRNYIPPQYYQRYVAISAICKDMCSSETNLKTQMRFKHGDIEVLTKYKGSEEPYRILPLTELKDFDSIPGYDHSIRWNKKVDRPARREITSSPRRGYPESRSSNVQSTQSALPAQSDQPKEDGGKKASYHSLSRTSSGETKNKKTKLNAPSSNSGSEVDEQI